VARTLRLRSKHVRPDASAVLLGVTPRQAGWKYISFAVRQISAGQRWTGKTGGSEMCAVLLQGKCRVSWDRHSNELLGPRADVFSSYPYAAYLPRDTTFSFAAEDLTILAEGRAPAQRVFQPRVIKPEHCGFEIRGGGNATRQIVDIMPPEFPAERLMICEVFTPSGNWSSYPPHKHDTDDPPREVDLEETYYYRFRDPDGFGIQRLYRADDQRDAAITVKNGDVVIIRDGYHPFVGAYGYDAYYLNVLAGTRRSMAASDDPRYAGFRSRWPDRDARLPMVKPPYPYSSAQRPAWPRQL
jgi:5-deoxy-glucuronate isomerase